MEYNKDAVSMVILVSEVQDEKSSGEVGRRGGGWFGKHSGQGKFVGLAKKKNVQAFGTGIPTAIEVNP